MPIRPTYNDAVFSLRYRYTKNIIIYDKKADFYCLTYKSKIVKTF